MTTEIKANYTEAQTTQAVQDYQAGVSIEQIAETLGKSTRSVIAKLVREGVYQSKSRTLNHSKPTKADTIQEIAARLNLPQEALQSLEKATLPTLQLLKQAITELV